MSSYIFNFNSSYENFRNANFNLRINLGNRFNFGNFDFSNLNANNCCVEQPLADISFGYDIGARVSISSGDIIIQETIDYSEESILVVADNVATDSFSNIMNVPEFPPVMDNTSKNFGKLGMSK